MLNGPTLFSRVNHTGSSYSVVACQFNFFHFVMIHHKLKTSANRKGIELEFRANTWRLTRISTAEVSELVILCRCARTAAQTVADVSNRDTLYMYENIHNIVVLDCGRICWSTVVVRAMMLDENISIDK